MDRRRVERIANELGVVLVAVTAATSVVALADAFLDWDLFDGLVQRLAGFLIAALVVQVAAATLVSWTLALRRIADALESAGRVAGRGAESGDR